MASLACHEFCADIGIGITGHTETLSDIEMGKVSIAIDNERVKQQTLQRYSERYPQMKRRAAYYALLDLKRMLLRQS